MTLRGIGLAALAATLSGCVTGPIGPPATSIRAVRSASAADFPPLAIGSSVRGPEFSAAQDRALGLRAATIKPPNGTSFAAYLGETAAAQLALGAKLEPGSPRVLSGVLTENMANPAIGRAHGALAARFTLSLHGKPVFTKELRVESEWDSSFIGAVAISAAEREYTGFYSLLIEKLFDDPEFRAALRTAG